MGCQLSFSSKELGEVLIHPLGDATMLATSQGCQQATISLGILPNLGQALADILAQLGEVLLVLKMLIHPDITIIIREPTRAMTPIVGNVEWLIAFCYLCETGLCHRIGIINATHLLLCLGK